jgi:hypothetical protein
MSGGWCLAPRLLPAGGPEQGQLPRPAQKGGRHRVRIDRVLTALDTLLEILDLAVWLPWHPYSQIGWCRQ